MKLKQITGDVIVHTPTEEEAIELIDILYENGHRWNFGKMDVTSWDTYKDLTCYHIRSTKVMNYCYKLFYQDRGYFIVTFAEFKLLYCDEEAKGETKELNLCELLKGHEGEEFFSLAHGDVKLDHVSPTIEFCIAVNKRNGDKERFYRNGRWLRDGIVMLFPSRALYEQYPLDPYTAWMKWQEEQKKPFICIHWGEVDCNGDEEEDYTGNTYFRTPADRDKCIEEIKAVIEKWTK